jgi:hypothetical protein
MAQLYIKVKLYLEANSKTWEAEQNNIRLQNNGDGDYIHTWSVDGLEKPTAEQIASYETAGNTEEANNVVILKRKTAYGPWDKQLEEIYDNGIDSWKARILQIKTDNPKS